MEKRLHFPDRHQSLPVFRLGKIEHDERQRQGLESTVTAGAVAEFVHPRPAAFEPGADVRVKIEMRDFAAAFGNGEEPYVGMPDGRLRLARQLRNFNSEEELRHPEKSGEHVLEFETALEFLFAVGVLAFAEPLRRIRDIPGFQSVFDTREFRGGRFQLGAFPLGALRRRRVKAIDHVNDGGHSRRAFGSERKLGVIRETEQLRHFGAELQRFDDARFVFRRSGLALAVKRFSERTVLLVLHRLNIRGIGDLRSGRVDDGVAEIGRQKRETGLNFVEALLRRAFKRDAGEFRALNHLFENAPPYGIGIGLGNERSGDFIQALRLSDTQRKSDDPSLEILLNLPPRLVVHHRKHVRNGAPAMPERVGRIVERPDEILVFRGCGGLYRHDRRLRLV